MHTNAGRTHARFVSVSNTNAKPRPVFGSIPDPSTIPEWVVRQEKKYSNSELLYSSVISLNPQHGSQYSCGDFHIGKPSPLGSYGTPIRRNLQMGDVGSHESFIFTCYCSVMNFTNRTKISLAVLVVVALAVSLYLAYFFNPGFTSVPFFGHATSTSNGTATNGTGKPVAGTGTTPPKDTAAAGYTLTTNGTLQIVSSPIAGVALVVPLNTDISVASGVLSIQPPESTKGEKLLIHKTTGGYTDALPLVRTSLDGTQNAFDVLHNAKDSSEFNPGNVTNLAHITKLGNRTIDDVAAVSLRITTTEASPRDFYVIWVHSGISNWYITRTAQGLTPAAKSSLDTIVSSIRLIR